MSDEDPAKGFAKLLAGWGISGRSPPRERSPERMMRKRIRIFTEAKTFYYCQYGLTVRRLFLP